MPFGIFGWVALALILVLGAVLGAVGAGHGFKDILISWGVGLWAIAVVAVIGGLMMFWSAWLGLAFFVVAGLYIVDRMLKD